MDDFLSGRKILLVEDVRFTRLTLAEMVRLLGSAAIFEASDGVAALELLQGEAAGADCVITDMEMPRLDGLGLLKAIREGTGAIPRDTNVVLLTGHSDLDYIGPALFLDIDGFLSKPLSKSTMRSCLQRLLGGAPVPRASEMSFRTQSSTPASQAQSERAVAISDIPADAELARDLLFGNGRLLLRAGSRLSPRIKDRLGELAAMAGLPPEVWINSP